METSCRFSTKKIVIAVILGLGVGLLIYYSPAFFIEKDKDESVPHLQVAGTSVVHFMMDKWGNLYLKDKKIKVDYDSTG